MSLFIKHKRSNLSYKLELLEGNSPPQTKLLRVETVAKFKAMQCKPVAANSTQHRENTCTSTVPLEHRTVLASHITQQQWCFKSCTSAELNTSMEFRVQSAYTLKNCYMVCIVTFLRSFPPLLIATLRQSDCDCWLYTKSLKNNCVLLGVTGMPACCCICRNYPASSSTCRKKATRVGMCSSVMTHVYGWSLLATARRTRDGMCDRSAERQSFAFFNESSPCHSLALKGEHFPGKYNIYTVSIVLKCLTSSVNLETT